MKSIGIIICFILISASFSFAEKQSVAECLPDQIIIPPAGVNELNGDMTENIIPDQGIIVPFSGTDELDDDLFCDDDDDSDVIYQKCEYKIKVKRYCYFLNKFELFFIPSSVIRNNAALYSKTDFTTISFVFINHAKRLLVLRI